MFAVGHISLGYITGRPTSSLLKVKVNLPLLFVASLLPDIDIIIPGIEHRGPTHSVFFILALAIPLLLLWRKRAVPYIVALASHSFLGDYLTTPSGAQGVQLLTPLSQTWFTAGYEKIQFQYIYIELALFAIFILMIWATGDLKKLMQAHLSNILLIIPIAATSLPALLQIPIPVPRILIIPHLILTGLLMLPILTDFKQHFHHLRTGMLRKKSNSQRLISNIQTSSLHLF